MPQKQPPDVFYEKAILKNLAIFTGKQLCQSLFRPTTLIKTDSYTSVFCQYYETLKNTYLGEWRFKKYVRLKFSIFDPLPPLVRSTCKHVPPTTIPSPQRKFTPLPLKNSPETFMNFQLKNRGEKREQTINFFVTST